MRLGRTLAACAAVLASLTACDATLTIGDPPSGGPKCPAPAAPTPNRLSGPLLLTAQAVPTAALVPCLRPLPAGWTFRSLDARKGKAKVVLDLGNNNQRAATVSLTRDCDVSDATEASTDQPGTRRYGHVDGDTSDYRGEQYYLFPGGCVSYEFSVHGPAAAAQVRTVSQALGFVDRDVLRRFVHDRGDGRFELDPDGS
jgi:hypothetical protein